MLPTGRKSHEADKILTHWSFWRIGQSNMKITVKTYNFIQNSSVTISWEPPDSPENVNKCYLQRITLAASDVPKNTTILWQAVWTERAVLTCGSQVENVLRTMFAYFFFLHISSVAPLISSLSSSEQCSTSVTLSSKNSSQGMWTLICYWSQFCVQCHKKAIVFALNSPNVKPIPANSSQVICLSIVCPCYSS